MEYIGKVQKVADNANSNRLVNLIVQNSRQAAKQFIKSGYANRYVVRGKNKNVLPVLTAKNIWNFLKAVVKYKKDLPERQQIILPSALLYLRKGDCKSFSVFIAGALTALGIKNGLYFSSYKFYNKPSHVYNWVLNTRGRKIPVDGCYRIFGKMKKPTYLRSVNIN